jgi:hypothetical protein
VGGREAKSGGDPPHSKTLPRLRPLTPTSQPTTGGATETQSGVAQFLQTERELSRNHPGFRKAGR